MRGTRFAKVIVVIEMFSPRVLPRWLILSQYIVKKKKKTIFSSANACIGKMYTSVPLAQPDIFNKMIRGRILSCSPDTAGRVLEACVGRCLERPSRQQQSAVPCDVSPSLQPQNSSLDGKQFISGNCFVFFTGKVKMNCKCYVCFYLQMINWLIVAFLNCHDSP